MKHLLLTTIAAVVLVVGCGESQKSAPAPETKPVEPVAGAKAPDISIHRAALDGNIEAVKKHLAAGTDVDTKDDIGTPLHIAAMFLGHKEIVEMLIAAGADVNAKEGEGYTPLDFAIINENTENADILLEHGGKSGATDSIQVAASVGNIEAVKRHLAAGVDVNTKSEVYGGTPLHRAANKEVVELLIAKGAKVDTKDKNGWTSLHGAIARDRKEIAELLIDKGADVNAKSDGDWTPLHFAAANGHKEIAELLITKGADVNAKDDDGSTSLDRAIQNNQTETADLLRKHGGKTGEELKAEGK